MKVNDQRKQIILNRLEQIERNAYARGLAAGRAESAQEARTKGYGIGYLDGMAAGRVVAGHEARTPDHNAIHAAYREGFADARERALEVLAKALNK